MQRRLLGNVWHILETHEPFICTRVMHAHPDLTPEHAVTGLAGGGPQQTLTIVMLWLCMQEVGHSKP